MKIIKIEQEKDIYLVTKRPCLIASLFGAKEKTYKYKETGFVYEVGGGHEYIDENGVSQGNILSETREAIDNWRRRF